MSAAIRVSSVVTSRYANALIELSEEKKALDKVESDVKALEQMIAASEDLRLLIADPRIAKTDQQAAMSELAKKAKMTDLTKNFLMVLIENRRLNILEPLIVAIHKQLAEKRGERVAKICVAQDLTDKQRKELEAALAKSSGSKITLDVQVDPSLLGGMVVTLDSRMIDDSVAGKLERLRLAMGRGSNENLEAPPSKDAKPKAKKAKAK
ncbi:MAG: F0F1 ATP synthase subunit delta [Alphaproteobacteria bacterium]